jgi:hypothetical protein
MDELTKKIEDNELWKIQNEYLQNEYLEQEKYTPFYNSNTHSFCKLENKHIFVKNGIKSLIIDMKNINEYNLCENTFNMSKNIRIDLPDDINILAIENIENNTINFNLNLDKLVILEITSVDCIGDYFIDKIDVFPRNLKHLTIGQYYNNPLDNLPCGLISLKILEHFNQPLDNLPSTIKILNFNRPSEFNQTLDYLPYGLKILEFDRYSSFNQPLNNLPSSLEILSFFLDSEFNQPLLNIPTNLKKFIGGNSFMQYESINNFHDNIEYIDIAFSFSKIEEIDKIHIPKSCKYCRIGIAYISKNNLYQYIKQKYPDIEFDIW